MEESSIVGEQCFWKTKTEIKILKSADFYKDCSDMAIHPDGKVVTLSQESASSLFGDTSGISRIQYFGYIIT